MTNPQTLGDDGEAFQCLFAARTAPLFAYEKCKYDDLKIRLTQY